MDNFMVYKHLLWDLIERIIHFIQSFPPRKFHYEVKLFTQSEFKYTLTSPFTLINISKVNNSNSKMGWILDTVEHANHGIFVNFLMLVKLPTWKDNIIKCC